MKKHYLFSFLISFLAVFILSSVPVHAALTDNLVGYWNLNEASGTRADAVGSNTLSEVGGTVSSAEGKTGNAASFSGSNYLNIADNAALSTGDIDFTVGGWVYLTNKNTTRPLIMKRSASANREYGIYYSTTGGFTFSVSNDGSTQTIISGNNGSSVEINRWYYVIAWHDSVNDTINVQVNNGTIRSASYSGGLIDTNAAFTLGAYDSGATLVSSGSKIDSVGLWKRILTSDERLQLYGGGGGMEHPFVLSPASPTNVVAQSDDTQSVVLWTAAYDKGFAVTDYIIEYKLSADSSWTTFNDGVSTATTATVTGLTNGVSYDFRVSAVNSQGTGTVSATSVAIPRASDLTAGLAAFYNLNELTGTRADSLGVSNLSETGGTIGTAAGKIKKAAVFAGGTAFLSTPDSATLSNGNNDFTLAGWVYLYSKGNSKAIAMKYSTVSGDNREYGIYYNSINDRLQFTVSADGISTTALRANTLGAPALNTWYYVVGWHDSVNDTVNIQVNNGAIDSQAYSSGVFDGPSPFTVGSFSNANIMNGRIDAVGMWKKVLIPSERAALYRAGAGLEYPFDNSNSITISAPQSYRVIQRDGTDHADINISGTYSGTPASIEASWNGGPYTVIDSVFNGGEFSGVLPNQSVGQGTLTVRFSDNTSISDSSGYVGIGDIFVVAGQSNASGRGSGNNSYTHATLKAGLFGNDDDWKDLADPTDSNAGIIDEVSMETATVGGSAWPLLATYIMADQSVPVAFVPAAKGGVTIEAWAKDSAIRVNGLNLYESMARRIAAVGGQVKAVIWHQGESNADTSPADYLAMLSTLANNMHADFGIKVLTGQPGNGDVSNPRENNRIAHSRAWNGDAGSNVYPAGPSYVDINLADEGGDSTHFISSADMTTFARRWWAAMKVAIYGGTGDGRGPRFQSATHVPGSNQILINFTDSEGLSNDPVSQDAFIVTSNGTPVSVSSVEKTSESQLKLTLVTTAAAPLIVSIAHTTTGAVLAGNGIVPKDTSTYALPVEMFYNEAVTEGTVPSSGGGGGGSSGGGGPAYVPPVTTPPAATPTDCRPGDLFSGSTGLRCMTATTTPTTVVPAATFTRNLTLKSTGEDVRALQQYLNAKGFIVAITGAGSPGFETATFGPATKAALARFQAANGIAPTNGYFGPITRAFMGSAAPVINVPVTGQVLTVISKIDLNVRATPSLQGSKLGTVPPGTTGAVIESTSEWKKMKFPAIEGWVYAEYVK